MMHNRNIPQEVCDGAIKLSTFLSMQFPKYKKVPGNFYSYNDINIVNAVIFYSSRNPDLNIKSLPNFFDEIQD